MRILTMLFLVFISCKNVNTKENEQEKVVVDSTEFKTKSSNNKQENLISNGIWISTIDSLSTVEISGNNWLFKYNNDKIAPNDYYEYLIKESIYDKDSAIVGGSLVLTKESDTLTYGIEHISDKRMTLIYLPRGNFQDFKKKE